MIQASSPESGVTVLDVCVLDVTVLDVSGGVRVVGVRRRLREYR